MNAPAKVKNILLIGIVALGLLGLYGFVQADDTAPMEKCYGIAKAGLNDCEPTQNSVTCDKSVVDADPNYWIYLPKGSCDKIVGGMTSMNASATPTTPATPTTTTPATPATTTPTTPATPSTSATTTPNMMTSTSSSTTTTTTTPPATSGDASAKTATPAN